jgi:hypothetical protein
MDFFPVKDRVKIECVEYDEVFFDSFQLQKMNCESSSSQQRLETLFKQYQFKSQLLLGHQRASGEKSIQAMAISEIILDLNNQIRAMHKKDDLIIILDKRITAETSRLDRAEMDIADDFKIVDLICKDLVNISEAIKVFSLI